MSPAFRIASALAVGLATAGGASGAIIVNVPAPVVSGAGTASVLVVTGTPNNDNSTVPGATIAITGKNFTSVAPIDIVFTTNASGGTTEYFVSEGITNSTGSTWVGYSVQLGFGTGSAFVQSGGSDFLDFDTAERDPTPAYSAFTALVHNPNNLGWSGGSVPNGMAVAASFSIDVPDGLAGVFTLRQTPIVPEPASLSALAGVALAAGRRVRRRA